MVIILFTLLMVIVLCFDQFEKGSMKILLISPYLDITSLSTRVLSSYLKASGHYVRQVFLPDLESMMVNGFDFV